MPARERTNVFKMIEIAEKREAAIQKMRKLQGFEFIMLNRKDILVFILYLFVSEKQAKAKQRAFIKIPPQQISEQLQKSAG